LGGPLPVAACPLRLSNSSATAFIADWSFIRFGGRFGDALLEEDCDKLSAAADCDDEDAARRFVGMFVLGTFSYRIIIIM
jgi:hypothetical protein